MDMAMARSSSHTSSESESCEEQIGSEGLTKRILRRGVSWQTPFFGDEVEVHFSGHAENGASLESSYDRGAPFKFKLGQCEVIKGWDEGVATMKKGERAMFKIPPNLGYGEAGSPPFVPPYASLIFEIEMLSWYSIRDLTGDGCVVKKILKEGEGWATPKEIDDVIVKYEAKLENGTIVSKSDEGVEFGINDSYRFPALSIAAKTMRKGEKAEVAVKFMYGTGNRERTNKNDGCLASESNLIIEIELVSWKNVTDVLGDMKILKKIKVSGEGHDCPNEGSHIKVIYLCKLEDGTVIEMKGSEEHPFEFITNEEQVHDGLVRAILTMRKGEEATVIVSAEYSSNHDNWRTVSGNKVIYFDVKLIDFSKEKPFWKMDTKEKLEACERKKDDGNVLFKTGNFLDASKKYEQASKYVEFDHTFGDDDKCRANALRLSCYLNNAACKLKLEAYADVSRLCSKVLEYDQFNVKALYRRCQAYLRMFELEKAEADIQRALTIDPNNRELKVEYRELRSKQREYNKCQAQIFSTMLSKRAY